MGVLVAARNNEGFLFGLNTHDAFILAPDANERSARGEDPFIANPDHVPGAGLSMGTGNWRALAQALELDPSAESLKPADVMSCAGWYLSFNRPSAHTQWYIDQALVLETMGREAIARGAIEIAVVAD